jgi:hypothetical protein
VFTVCALVPSILSHTNNLAMGSAILLPNDVVAVQGDRGMNNTAANWCDR